MSLPEQAFNIVLADPPWRYCQNMGTLSVPYPTLSTPEIMAMKPNTTDDAALFLWTTSTHLCDALHVMHAWGFQYKRIAFVWIKNRPLMGYYTDNRVEIVLLGVRGKPTNVLKAWACESQLLQNQEVVEAPIKRHSQKPEDVQDRIDNMCLPETSKLEMFARRERKGWLCWGNEINSSGNQEQSAMDV